MSRSKACLLAANVLLFAFALAGCTSFLVVASNGRLLVAVSVNPNSIDPVNLSNGQAQFTAAGTFNMSPITVEPMTNVVWTIDRPAFSAMPESSNAFIDTNGVAHCAQGFIGTAQVFATAPANPDQPLSMQNQVVGSATIMCP